MTTRAEKVKRRLDGIYRQVRATIISEYAYHPVRFFSFCAAIVVALGVLAYFGPIRAQINELIPNKQVDTTVSKKQEKTDVEPINVPLLAEAAYFKNNETTLTADTSLILPVAGLTTATVEVKQAVSGEVMTDQFIINNTNDGQSIEVKPSEQIQAGRYEVVAKNPESGKIIAQKSVTWGVLAFNPDYAIYPPNTEANFAMAVLDDRGKMVCGADMTLEITDPQEQTTILSIEDKTIINSPDCLVYGPTSEPDYYAKYKVGADGKYSIKMVATVGEGKRTLEDSFFVKSNQDFYLKRSLPTRIYPPIGYEATLQFQAHRSGTYILIESVPDSFEIQNAKSKSQNDNPNFKIKETGKTKTLTWQFVAEKGQNVNLNYQFKAPNISPYLFIVGPATVNQPSAISSQQSAELKAESRKLKAASWLEPRSWQIASDNACTSNGTGGGNWNTAGSWAACGGVVPQAADTVQILANDTITLDTSASVQSVTIDANGTLTNNAVAQTLTLTATTGTLFTATGTFTPSTYITVTMNPDAAVTLTSNNTITFYTLNLTPTITTARIYTFGTGALTINGDLNIQPNSVGANRLTVNMGANITVASTNTTYVRRSGLAALSTLDTISGSNWALSTGFLNVATGGTLTAQAAIITLTGTSGTLFTRAGTFTQGTSDVQVTSASGTPTLLSAATTFYKLTINASGATVINMGAFVPTFAASGTLYVQAGVFNASGADITGPGAGSGTLQIDSGGTLCLGGTTASTTATCNSGASDTTTRAMPTFQTYTFNAASTVSYLSDAATTVSQTPTYGNLKLNPKFVTTARVYTFGGVMTINGNFDLNPDESGASTPALTVNPAGNITVATGKTTTITRTNSATSSLDLRPVSTNYNLSTGLLSIATGGTLDATSAASTITFSGTSGTLFTVTGTFIEGLTTVRFTGDGSPTALNGNTVEASTFWNLALVPAISTADRTYTLGTTALTVNGIFDIVPTGSMLLTVNPQSDITVASTKQTSISGGGATATLDLRPFTTDYNFSTGNLVIQSGGKLDGTSAASTITLTYTSGTLFAIYGTFTQGTTDVRVTSASGTPTLLSAATTFHKLTINSAATVINMGAFAPTINNVAGAQLYVQAGVFNASGASITGPGGTNGTLQIDASATLCLGGTTASTTATCNSGATDTTTRAMPTFQTYTFAATSTVSYLSNAATTVSSTPTYGNLKLNPVFVTTSRTYTFGGVMTINGNFDLNPDESGAGTPALTVNPAGDITVAAGKTTTITRTNSATSSLDLRPVSTDYNLSTGSINIAIGGTLDAGGSVSTITVKGDWTNAGTFIQGTSTVTFSGTGAQAVNSSTTWYNLSMTTSATRTITFTVATTQTIATGGSATLTGAAANLLTLQSGAASSDWNFAIPVASSRTVDYTAAIDANATDSAVVATNSTCLRTTNWTCPSGFSIGGTVYGTDESTPVATGPTVRAKVNGAGTYSAVANGSGVYSITSVTMVAGDALTVYLDTGGGITGATFTISTGADMTGININQDRATVRCDNTCSLTNANINNWDKDDDIDIHAAAAVTTNILTVDNDWKLLVATNTFAPGAAVTTTAGGANAYSGNVEIKSASVLNIAANALSIGGSYSNSGTFTTTTNTTTFAATATGKTLSGTMTGSSSFYNLIFNGSGGGWSNSAAMTATGALTMTAGTLSGTNNVTVNGNAVGTAGIITLTGGTFEQRVGANQSFGTSSDSVAWTFNDLIFSNSSGALGSIITTQSPTTPGGINVTNTLTIGRGTDTQATSLNAGNQTWTLSGTGGDPFQLTATFGSLTASTSTFTYTGNNGAGNTIVQTTTYYNLTPNNAAETYVLEEATIVNNNLTITAGILDTVSGSNWGLTIKGNYSNSGTFTANSGTVTLSGTSTQTLSGTMTTTSAFYNLTITNASGTVASDCERTDWVAGVDFNAAATVTNAYAITTASVKIEYNTGSTYTFANINWNGQAVGTRIYFRNSAVTGTWLMNVTAVGNAQTKISYVNVSRSDASSGAMIIASDGTNTDCANNTYWQFDETLTLGLDSTSKDFGVVLPGSNPSDQTSTLTVTSNAVNGYVIYAWSTQAMTNVRFGGVTLADWTGMNAAPTTFGVGSYGFGYTTDDNDLTGGTADRFSAGTKFAGFTHSGPGNPVADRTTPATGATNTTSYRMYPSSTQANGDYTTIIVYVIAAQFP